MWENPRLDRVLPQAPGSTVWAVAIAPDNVLTGAEIPNLYIMDSSIFPTSVGANPMQSIYTFAYIFSKRLLQGMA